MGSAGAEGYRTFDHTGDLGLEVWAATPERLFGLAAEALMAQVAETRSEARDVRVHVRLTGDDPADLFVHWLNTVLLQSELERAVWTRATLHELSERSLDAVLEGARLDASRHVRLREIKAVSHHDLLLTTEAPDCRCRLVLDI